MAKLKKSRRNRNRTNPLARGNGQPAADSKADETARRKALPLVEKLSSSSGNDRAMALAAIAVLCDDEQCRKALLKERIISKIMEQCLTGGDDEIMVEAFGVLRNIAVEEGYDVIQHLWRLDIWSAIASGLDKIQRSFQYLASGQASAIGNKRADEKARLQLLYDYTENVYMLVVVIASGSASLCEAVFAHIDVLLALAIDILSWNAPAVRTSLRLHVALLEFVYEFAAESQEFIHKLQGRLDPARLLAATPSVPLTEVYAMAIQYHLSEHQMTALDVDAVLREMFGRIVAINLDDTAAKLRAPDNANFPIQKNPEPQEISQPLGGQLEEQWRARSDIQAIETALDVATAVWEMLATGSIPSAPVVPAVLQVVLPCLVELAMVNAASDIGIGPRLVACLRNLCWMMLEVQPLPTAWHDAGLQIWDICAGFDPTGDLSVGNDCLSACWAAVLAVGPLVAAKTTPDSLRHTAQSTRSVLGLASAAEPSDSETTEWLATAVGLLGAVVVLVATDDNEYISAVQEVAAVIADCVQWLVTAGTGGERVMVEGLNAMYDIFGDCNHVYDAAVFVQQGYLLRLQQMEPAVRATYKRIDKQQHPETKARAEEAWGNMTRFLQYKRSEQ